MNQKTVPLASPILVLILLILSSPAISPSPADGKSHFVLVHGGCFGAWSWYKVSTILQASGHAVTALDMAASGIDPRQPKTISSAADYFQPLNDFLAALPPGERVVLVAHSFGGLGLAVAMENFPEKIAAAVFVAAVMPGPNLTVSAIGIEDEKQRFPALDSHYLYENGEDKPPTSYILGPQKLAKHLFPLSPPQDLTLAKALVRPLPVFETKDSEFNFTEERYGSVKRGVIVTEKDLMATRKFQMWMIQNNPPHITVEIRASDHMAMASKPRQFARQLQRIANQLFLFDF
ncbi:methylesterase 3-like [Momordica charantia]|uniref:Methylesterase 3-like n=1 Tax=Momordica charantia TaxID=3673 RepID=A0A6J1CFI6_MOMCH|nr:methylesterase 3-like [Momordica charantia]